MNTNKKIPSPPPNNSTLTFPKKIHHPSPPPLKKFQLSQKQHPHHPPLIKINLPNLHDLRKAIDVLKALCNISFVGEIKKKNLQN